jgi:hypothetical protein
MCFYRNIGVNYRGDKLVDGRGRLPSASPGAGRSAVFRDERLQYIQLFSNLILGPTLIQEPPQLGDLVIAGLVTEQCELAVRSATSGFGSGLLARQEREFLSPRAREEQILWFVTSQGFLRGIASSDVQKGVRMPLR